MTWFARLRDLEEFPTALETELPKLPKVPSGSFGSASTRDSENSINATPPPHVVTWAASDWRTHFEERLAVAMIDGEQPEAEARRIAYECYVVLWLDLHSVTSAPDRCAWCGKVDKPGNILPFGAAPAGHVWLHAGCWPHWSSQRREQAAVALAKLGITR